MCTACIEIMCYTEHLIMESLECVRLLAGNDTGLFLLQSAPNTMHLVFIITGRESMCIGVQMGRHDFLDDSTNRMECSSVHQTLTDADMIDSGSDIACVLQSLCLDLMAWSNPPDVLGSKAGLTLSYY